VYTGRRFYNPLFRFARFFRRPGSPGHGGRTDGQTDGQTNRRTTYDSNTAVALRASRGKKVKGVYSSSWEPISELQSIMGGQLDGLIPFWQPANCTY